LIPANVKEIVAQIRKFLGIDKWKQAKTAKLG